MNDPLQNVQTVLDSQIGKSGFHNIVAGVQSQDKEIDCVGAAG